MPVYTNIPKPTGASYTRINPHGREQYDDSFVLYDDTVCYYDGTSQTSGNPGGNDWTMVAKPAGTPYINVMKPST